MPRPPLRDRGEDATDDPAVPHDVGDVALGDERFELGMRELERVEQCAHLLQVHVRAVG